MSFNRPKAISCLATRQSLVIAWVAALRFNRPKAISCLATTGWGSSESLARRFQSTGGD